MDKSNNPNYILADKIQNDLISKGLIADDQKDFLAKLANGKMKDSDWRAVLLDRIHRKNKPA